MLAHSGTLIAYATAPGTAVENGSGRNSVYTDHLLHFLKMPGLTVEQLFKEVRMAVARETGHRQIPWVSTSIPGGFSFSGSVVAAHEGHTLCSAAIAYRDRLMMYVS